MFGWKSDDLRVLEADSGGRKLTLILASDFLMCTHVLRPSTPHTEGENEGGRERGMYTHRY